MRIKRTIDLEEEKQHGTQSPGRRQTGFLRTPALRKYLQGSACRMYGGVAFMLFCGIAACAWDESVCNG